VKCHISELIKLIDLITSIIKNKHFVVNYYGHIVYFGVYLNMRRGLF